MGDEAINESEYWTYPASVIPSANFLQTLASSSHKISFTPDCKEVSFPWHFFQYNQWGIEQDFEVAVSLQSATSLPENNQYLMPERIFIDAEARVQCSILNATAGPIYIGKNVEIMEGSLLRGPLYIGDHSVVKMGTKIYGATSIGPYCTVGGEIKNATIMGFSNKAHDGYLGDAVLGRWCNLGAGTSNSNLKNNGSTVRVWNKVTMQYDEAGIKCGLIMGDYSRSAINTSFDTGSVVGICCNIFDRNPTKFIDSFSWGKERYEEEKMLRDIQVWRGFKHQKPDHEEIAKIKKIYANQ